MAAGHVLEPVVLEWAALDADVQCAQGGGAVLVTKDKLYWFIPHELAMKKWRNIEKRRAR